MGLYAKGTGVSVLNSKMEIERILTRYGADRHGVMAEPGRAFVVFERGGRRVQIEMFLPHPEDKIFKAVNSSAKRSAGDFDAAKHEQACRQKWRALVLMLKAKLEAVESGITSFEQEFLAHLVLPNGQGTVGKWLGPQLESAYKTGRMPPLLGAGS